MAAACGTYAGYQRHGRRGEPKCQPCLDAQAAYFAERRMRPGIRERERQRAYARERALARLAEEFPGRYRQLFAEEVAR